MLEIQFGNARERKAFVKSLLFSIIVLIAGLAWSYKIGLKANLLEHELGHASDYLEMLNKQNSNPAAGPKGGAK